MPWIQEIGNDVLLSVRVVPRAAKDEAADILGDSLKIRLSAPPVDGKANQALTRFLAQTLKIPPRDVRIVSGTRGRNKRVRIRNITARLAQERLAPLTRSWPA